MLVFHRVMVVLFIVFLISGCVPRQFRVTDNRSEQLTAANSNIYVRSPTVSPDGRYVVFDVHTFIPGGVAYPRSRSMLALYDIKTQTIEYLAPENELVIWHSPSFDQTGQYLTMISQCRYEACTGWERGSQIGILNLSTKDFLQVTDGRGSLSMWYYSETTGKASKSKNTSNSSGTIRGYPIFSSDGKALFYVANTIAWGSTIFSEQYHPRYQLRQVDISDPDCKLTCKDELVMKIDPGAVLFQGDGRIAMLGNDTFIFAGFSGLGRKTKELENKGPFSFYYNQKSKELSTALGYKEIPKDPKLKNNQIYPFIRSITTSHDGSKIAFIHGFRNTVSIWQGEALKTVLTAEQVGVKGEAFGYSAISGDGNWLVVFPNNKNVLHRQENFWLMNLKTMTYEEMPLRRLLRQKFLNKRGGK